MSNDKLKKSAHTLDTEDLLSVLESNEPTEEDDPIDYANDVLRFIATFNLEPGQEKIKSHTLYLIYKVWSQNPIVKGEFSNKLGNYFENTKIGSHSAYFINQNAIKLTHEAYKYFNNSNRRLKSRKWAKHFENFLKFHSLTKGETYTDVRMLYFIYDKYTHATGLDRIVSGHLSKVNFTLYCKIYLPEKRTKNGVLFGVSDNIKQFFQLNQLQRMQEMYEKEKKQKNREYRTRFKSKAKSKKKG